VTGSQGVTARLPNTIYNPNLKEQYSNESQYFVERVIPGGYKARVGYTYIWNSDQWIQIPSNMPYSAWNTAYTVFDYGPTTAPCLQSGTTVCKAGGTAHTVYDIAKQYTAATYSQTMYVNRTNSVDHFGTLEFAVAKSMSHRVSFSAGYTATKNHAYCTNITCSTTGAAAGNGGPQAIVTSPNQLNFPLNTSWYWTGRFSGNIRLPWKFDISPVLNIYTGKNGYRYLSFTLPNSGSESLPLEPFGSELNQYRVVLNFRLSRDFKFERAGTFRANFELLNATNNSSAWGVVGYASGSSFDKVNSTSMPIIARFGVIWQK
jgi:hypothetical protein